ncbi:MAG: hypothetical protein PHT40_00150 [Patescibacteria group bacterium]|nr:hypothetical protein [Patescibacteria group bacterium]
MAAKLTGENIGTRLQEIKTDLIIALNIFLQILKQDDGDGTVAEVREEINKIMKELQKSLALLDKHFPPGKPAVEKSVGNVLAEDGKDFGE